MAIPADPKIYHIVHVDRLSSIVADEWLWCDAEIVRRSPPGTTIGMNSIKARRLNELTLTSHPDLYVGSCVPFYFCPRSIMLFKIHKANDPELTYKGGQGPIIHLEADLRSVVDWAHANHHRWAFTLSNAGSYYFEDRSNLDQLGEIDWAAVHNNGWGYQGVSQSVREGKQAEFLIERQFPWELVSRIGVISREISDRVNTALQAAAHKPRIEITPDWYY
jgi:ssDNA thymidine ADP-ribosyltransferase DarT-like protein